jgi:hypothetical protein
MKHTLIGPQEQDNDGHSASRDCMSKQPHDSNQPGTLATCDEKPTAKVSPAACGSSVIATHFLMTTAFQAIFERSAIVP